MNSMRVSKSRIVDAACRTDFVSLFRKAFHTLMPHAELLLNWHIYALAFKFEQMRFGIIKRLIVNVPPRSLKSTMMVAFAAFLLGLDPTVRIILVTYGADLSIKFTNDLRAILNSAWYQQLFPGTRISRAKDTELEIQTTRNGYFLASSIDGALTGRGADFIFVDDPIKPMDAFSDNKRQRVNTWFNSTLLSRLDDQQKGCIVVLMQRLHPDDLSGMLLHTSNEWTPLALAAICERDERIQIGHDEYHLRHRGEALHSERQPLHVLERIRGQIGAEMFSAQFQQAPVPAQGVAVNRGWFRRYDQLPARTSNSKIIVSVDTASKEGELNDYSACVTLLYHAGKYYLVDVFRGRFDYPTLKARVIAHARTYRANIILVEDAGVGTALVAELKNGRLPAVAVQPQVNKKMRMAIQSEKFKNGTILLPTQALWLRDFEDELAAFPHSRHDDQVDALSQALAYEPPKYTYSGYENVDWQGILTNWYLQTGGGTRPW
jgi:predicted phage terminase large subunit-like protein